MHKFQINGVFLRKLNEDQAMTLQSAKNTDKIPEPTLRRLPWYLSCAKLMRGKV